MPSFKIRVRMKSHGQIIISRNEMAGRSPNELAEEIEQARISGSEIMIPQGDVIDGSDIASVALFLG